VQGIEISANAVMESEEKARQPTGIARRASDHLSGNLRASDTGASLRGPDNRRASEDRSMMSSMLAQRRHSASSITRTNSSSCLDEASTPGALRGGAKTTDDMAARKRSFFHFVKRDEKRLSSGERRSSSKDESSPQWRSSFMFRCSSALTGTSSTQSSARDGAQPETSSAVDEAFDSLESSHRKRSFTVLPSTCEEAA